MSVIWFQWWFICLVYHSLESILHYIQVSVWFCGVVCLFSFISFWRRSYTVFKCMFSFISTWRRSYTMFRCMFSFMSAWRRSDTMFTFMFSFTCTQRRSYTMVRCMFSFISIQRRSETMFRYMFSFISIQRRSETMFRYMFSFISTPWSDPTPCSDIVSSLPGEDPIPYSAFRCQCDFMLITPWRGSCITFGCQCDFMVLFVCLVPSLSGEDPSSHLGVGVISWCCLFV